MRERSARPAGRDARGLGSLEPFQDLRIALEVILDTENDGPRAVDRLDSNAHEKPWLRRLDDLVADAGIGFALTDCRSRCDCLTVREVDPAPDACDAVE